MPQTVPLGEILMLVCVPPQHQNQLTTVAHQSLHSTHANEDRNQEQTSKSKATVCGPVGSADPHLANSNSKTVYLVTYSQANVVKEPDREHFAEIVSNAFQPPKDNTPLV